MAGIGTRGRGQTANGSGQIVAKESGDHGKMNKCNELVWEMTENGL